MSKVLIDEQSLEDIADSIRAKNGTHNTYTPGEMSGAIDEIEGITGAFNQTLITSQFGNATRNAGVWITGVKKIIIELPADNVSGNTMTNCFFNFYGTDLNDCLNKLPYTHYCSCNGTFFGCANIQYLDLSEFNPSSCRTDGMFKGCTSLMKIDLRKLNFSVSENYVEMFGTSASDGVPDNCLIIVADQTQKNWLNNNFSRLTNVKTIAEYEASQV